MGKHDERAIFHTTERTRLGSLLVAGTRRGVCFVWLGGPRSEGRRRLEAAFPFAALDDLATPGTATAERKAIRAWAREIRESVDGRGRELEVPLDVRGSAFEKRVWAALRRIPPGETRSYSEVARAVGSPRGARAVANACASNPAPFITPCHRVVRQDGTLGGFALGVGRKRKLLEAEGALD